MTTRGRPRLVTPGMLAEAASELFLEQGYHQTSVDDIASRAGVSRATFFNYFPAKADVLFDTIDQMLDAIDEEVHSGRVPLEVVLEYALSVNREDLPLIATQAEAMSAQEDVSKVGPVRVERLRTIMAQQFPDSLDHWLVTAAIVSAAMSWATAQHTTDTLHEVMVAALKRVHGAV